MHSHRKCDSSVGDVKSLSGDSLGRFRGACAAVAMETGFCACVASPPPVRRTALRLHENRPFELNQNPNEKLMTLNQLH